MLELTCSQMPAWGGKKKMLVNIFFIFYFYLVCREDVCLIEWWGSSPCLCPCRYRCSVSVLQDHVVHSFWNWGPCWAVPDSSVLLSMSCLWVLDFLEDECAEKEHGVLLRAQDELVPGSERQGCFTELHLLESVAAGNAEGCPEAKGLLLLQAKGKCYVQLWYNSAFHLLVLLRDYLILYFR